MTVHHTRALAPDYRDAVDRKDLRRLRDRFLAINAGRLQRTREAMPGRQQSVLDILPLLFHINHPLLPGFTSRETAHGIQGYAPDDAALDAAHRHSRTFQYRREAMHQAQILSLFMMGSTGTVAHGRASDMDLWLCVRPGLDAEHILRLRKKADAVSAWADELGLEMHIFLVDPEQFRQGRPDAAADQEDCGSAQHYLLLDEFYRSAVLIAGCYPAWWLIPHYDEPHYDEFVQMLLHKRFIKADEVIDFGGMAYFPPEEFLGAGLWQVSKGIDSPYKSVLKLLLTEVYAQEHPQVGCLSLIFKQRVFEGAIGLDELDPYVLLYRKLESYLLPRNEPERLELVRRCFYLKVGERLGQRSRSLSHPWRHELMQRLVKEWGWQGTQLKHLDARQSWKVNQVQKERRMLVSELTHGYRFISQHAKKHSLEAHIRAEDMTLLGRKLYAAFQRKAGKIDRINPGIAPSLEEEHLSFHHSSSQHLAQKQHSWMLFNDLESLADAPFHAPLKRSNSLLELIVWSHINGLLTSSSRTTVMEGDTALNQYELQGIIHSLQQRLPLPLPPVSQAALRNNQRMVRCLLFVNIGRDPLAHLSKRGIHKLSDRTDALGFSAFRENLVVSIDQVTVNSWNEVSVNRFEGQDALVKCLKNYLAAVHNAAGQVPELDVYCFCQSRATAIARRVEELFQDVSQSYFAQHCHPNTRYLVEIGDQFDIIQFRDGTPGFSTQPNQAALLDYLRQPLDHFSPLVLDRHALVNDPLGLVLQKPEPGVVKLFYRRQEQQAQFFILDECGSLFTLETPYLDDNTLLAPMHRFLSAVQERQRVQHDFDSAVAINDIRFYELRPTPRERGWQLEPRPLGPDATAIDYMEVQAIGTFERTGELEFDIYCDHQEYTALEYGEDLIPAVAHYILSKRRGSEHYPCYITDLGLPHDLNPADYQARLQTVQYLQYKQWLENALNAAMAGFLESQTA